MHRQPTLEATRLGDLLELVLGGVVDVGADAHHHMRRRHQMAKAFGSERGNLGEGLARDEFGRELAGDRHRYLHRLGLQPRLDADERAMQPVEAVGDQAKGAGDVLGGLRLGLRLAGGKTLTVGLRLGVGAPALVLDQRDGRLVAGGEVLVEQIFGGRFHFIFRCARSFFEKPFGIMRCLNRSALRRRGSWRSECRPWRRDPWRH
jgi:hypothetical protein